LSEKKTQKRFDVGKKLATCNMNLFAPGFSLEISGRPFLFLSNEMFNAFKKYFL